MNLSDAVRAACTDDWSGFSALVTARTGKVIADEVLEVFASEVLMHIRHEAPCKRDEWLSICTIPQTLYPLLVAVVSRQATNPHAVRTVQMGEYSKTFAGETVLGAGTLLSPTEARIVRLESGCGTKGIKPIRLTPTAPMVVGDDFWIEPLEATRPRPAGEAGVDG